MDTTRILAFRHPAQLDLLLDSLIAASVRLPEAARRIRDHSEMPAQLQRIAARARLKKSEWRAWARGRSLLLLVGELVEPLRKAPNRPVVLLQIYGANAQVKDRSQWVFLADGEWARIETRTVGVKAG